MVVGGGQAAILDRVGSWPKHLQIAPLFFFDPAV